MRPTSQNTHLFLCISSGLQRELTLQQSLGCLPDQLWELCGCLMLSWNLCKATLKSGLPLSLWSLASFGELPLQSYGRATGQRTCLSLSCNAPVPPIPQIPLMLTKRQTRSLPRSGWRKGTWDLACDNSTIRESSAAVIPIEKDGNHSLPLLFASAKYDNCFFRFYFANYINYWVETPYAYWFIEEDTAFVVLCLLCWRHSLCFCHQYFCHYNYEKITRDILSHKTFLCILLHRS